jgi:hypothetical protein
MIRTDLWPAALRAVLALMVLATAEVARSSTVAAQEAEPFIRTELRPGSTVVVGQPVQLMVAIFVPGFFRGAPQFEEIQIPNTISSPPGRSLNLTERQGRTTLAGQRRPYEITPQLPGVYEIPPISVTFTVGGRAPQTLTLTTEPLSFEAVIPEEARELPYFIGTPLLTAQQDVEPRADTLLVGEALSRTISVSVQKALSIVIPPLAPDSIPGLTLYMDPARVTDTGGERGEAREGTRVERLTYVAQDPGDYTLPPIEVAWWNLERSRVEWEILPAIEFTVEANPEAEPVFEAEMDHDSAAVALTERPESPIDWGTVRTVAAGLVALLLLVWGARRILLRLREWLARRAAERESSEAHRFQAVRTACRVNEPRAARAALARWMETVQGGGEVGPLADFARARNLSELAAEIEALDAHLYGPGEAGWTGGPLARAARQARDSLESARRAHRKEDRPFGLSDLNPV